MKAKTIVILLVVTLLCASIASAGFMDWVTGKAISLKGLFSKTKGLSPQPDPPGKAAASAAQASGVSPVEWDTKPAAYRGDALLVHTENNLRQLEATLNLVASKWDTKPAQIDDDITWEVKA